ncbi:hypothetical protein V7128_26640, partial [Neobacillus vireti]
MAHFPLNQQELPKRIESIYSKIIQAGQLVVDQPHLQDESRMCRDNFISYLALREQNLLGIRQELNEKGLVDFTQSYTHLLYTLEKILANLNIYSPRQTNLVVPTPDDSRKILTNRTRDLFGKSIELNQPAIMVTVDSKGLNHPNQIEELLLNGMGIARINCAHDDAETWQQLIVVIRDTEKKLRQEG